MSDPMMRPPMGGQPPGGGQMGGGAPGGNPVKDNMSMLNPTDLAVMKGTGQVQEGMSLGDYITSLGLDLDGPVGQLAEFAQKQVQNSSAMGKMKNIQPQGGPTPQMAQAPPQGQPGPPPGMDSLLGGMR